MLFKLTKRAYRLGSSPGDGGSHSYQFKKWVPSNLLGVKYKNNRACDCGHKSEPQGSNGGLKEPT